MRAVALVALIHGLVLAGYLWLNPIIASIGLPERPDIGRPSLKGDTDRLPTPPPVVSLPSTAVEYARTAQAAVQTPPAGVTILEEVERRVFEITNEMRRKHGKIPIVEDDGLRMVARAHSVDMVVRGYFDHVSLEGRTPVDRLAILHRRLIGIARENIASISGTDPAKVDELAQRFLTTWMDSPGHRDNILNDANSHLGVGIVVKDKEILATQLFAEAKTFLQDALSLQLRNHENLNLRVTSRPGGIEPARYDFWLPEQGIAAIPHKPVSEAQVNMPPGTYRLRLYFPKVGGYTIYNAPEVVVE